MSFQTDDLSLLTLGIQGDAPPSDSGQPPLPDGMHLRWVPDQERGFPWHGFYLFRRESEPRQPRCLSPELRRFRPGTSQSLSLETPLGRLSSARPLVFTEEFPPASVVEVDLDQGALLRFDLPAGVEARQVDVQIGLRSAISVVRTCVDFRTFPLGIFGPSPRTEKGAIFSVEAPRANPPAPAFTAIEQWPDSPPGLQCTRRLEVVLPCPATQVDLLLTNRGDLLIDGLVPGESHTGPQKFLALTLNAGLVTVTGKTLSGIAIEGAIEDLALLHQICWECLGAAPTPVPNPAVRQIIADFSDWPLGQRPNPVVEQGVRFEVRDESGHPLPFASFEKRVQVWTGLLARSQVEIQLPCATTKVTMQFSRGSNDPPVHVRAFNQDGTLAQSLEMHAGLFGAEPAVLEGAAITRLLVDAPGPDALLHHVIFNCDGGGAEIEVRALAGTTVAARTVVRGQAGQVVAASLAGAGITAVEIGPGRAALVDLCVLSTKQGVSFGWDTVPGFPYPLCLPVAHHDYPCPGKPATLADAQGLAFSRVTYTAPPGWNQDQGFSDLHGELAALVQGGPAGGSMASRKHPDLRGVSLSPATQADSPTLPGLRPLDQVILASLQPAFAQMLGLYFVDASVASGIGYDYILLADPTGVLGGSAAGALAWLAFTANMTQVDAVLVSNVKTTTRLPIAPPAEARAYALPGAAAREIDGTLPQVAGSVGLWWRLPPDSTDEEQPDQLLFYIVERASLGSTEPVAPPPADSEYQLLPGLSSILISEPDPQDPPEPPNPRSSEWPPPSLPLLAVNGNLAEGWYSFRVYGQTLFGRRSAFGPPAEWFEWDPPPEHLRHPFAVGLLDKTPPPVPLGVEAWALDPLDRWVLVDDAYTAWRNAHSALVGLRVRWRWTYLQQLQAPDTREFRLYYQPGRWNALLGRIVKVTAAAGQCDVDLDIADSHPDDAFAGARLRVGNADFAILGSSQQGAKLRLRVKNIGAHDEVSPAEGKPCTVAIPDQHPLWVDSGLAASWAKRLAFVSYDPPARTVYDPSKDPNEQPLTSENDAFKTVQVTVNGEDVLFGAGPDLSGIQPWIDRLWLKSGTASEAHRIVRYDVSTRIVTLDVASVLAGPPDAWILGRPAREYDVFLPAPDVGDGEPFKPSLEEPAVYAQIAVSAADDKDDPDRFGNESRLSPSATVFRVLQEPPQAPDLPDLGERLYATPADFHSRSYSTFRFTDPQKPLKVHILRAVDDSLFKRDWAIRETRVALDPVNPAHQDYFPDGLNARQRQTVADALNDLDPEVPYKGLSDEAWAVLALLPGNEAQPDRPALEKRDRSVRHTRGGLTEADADLFPQTWNEATRTLAADALNQLADPAGYSALPDNALRILASLYGNETAFTQVTLAPLEMADPQIKDERRPDDDVTYAPDPTLRRAYTDTLPGRAINRYFYRARFVDGAQNQGLLSLAGLPVYLRKVEPPRAPVITKVVGGDREITIRWAANREPDLSRYEIYRTDHEEVARDVRLMVLVSTQNVSGLPGSRPAEVEWVDLQVPSLMTVYYRLVAVDDAGNMSVPSVVATGRAFDDSRPDPPTWNPPVAGASLNEIALSWSSTILDLRCLVQRRIAGASVWDNVSNWLARGAYSCTDSDRIPGLQYDYRLRVMDGSGRTNNEYEELTA